MKTVQARALKQAQTILSALGLKYAIEVEPGKMIGELKLESAAPPKSVKRDFSKFKYQQKIKQAKAGEVLAFEIDGPSAEALQGSVSSACIHVRGKGSGMTALKRHADGTATVEILILK